LKNATPVVAPVVASPVVVALEAQPKKNKGKRAKKQRTMDSAVPSNPLIEHGEAILAAVVKVSGATDAAFGIYTDRGVLTEKHIIEQGAIKVAPWFSPAILTEIPRDAVVPIPGSLELVLLKTRINNCTAVDIRSFTPLVEQLKGDLSKMGTIVNPAGSISGMVNYKPGASEELLIHASTKAGMCGLPYVVNGKIVGVHAFGNNNQVNNGGLAITETIKKWLGQQQKN